MNEWIDRAEALALLGVKPQTLYAYVSRGQIEVRKQASGRRASLYRAEDVTQLARRADASRKPSAIAAGSMAWGEASIVTHISTVQHGRLIYRGEDAAALSAHATLESTARLLWSSDQPVDFNIPVDRHISAFEALAALMTTAEPTMGRGREKLCRDARIAIAHLAAGCGIAPDERALHKRLAALWSLAPGQSAMVRRALVLVADHELNASTFAARVAASTGAPIAACLLAGLSALAGPRHGGATAALMRMLGEAEREGPETVVRDWLERSPVLPGFGHPLYPNGDIRRITLEEMFDPDPLLRDLAAHVREATGALPNIDYGLVALSRIASLPAGAPFTLFLLGRSIGWAAHAMEQALEGRLIRPRARYEGALPSE